MWTELSLVSVFPSSTISFLRCCVATRIAHLWLNVGMVFYLGIVISPHFFLVFLCIFHCYGLLSRYFLWALYYVIKSFFCGWLQSIWINQLRGMCVFPSVHHVHFSWTSSFFWGEGVQSLNKERFFCSALTALKSSHPELKNGKYLSSLFEPNSLQT